MILLHSPSGEEVYIEDAFIVSIYGKQIGMIEDANSIISINIPRYQNSLFELVVKETPVEVYNIIKEKRDAGSKSQS